MKNLLKLKYYLLMPLMAAIILVSCSDDDEGTPDPSTGDPASGKVNIRFENQYDPMNSIPLELGETYVTSLGDSIQINTVKYWISNIKLYNADGLAYEDEDSYYLIEKTASNTREVISLENVPVDTYTKIEYSIGVDAESNDTLGSGKGELTIDSQVGMFWAWKTGYKFMRVDGMYYESDSSKFLNFNVHTGLDKYYIENEATLNLTVKEGEQHMIHFMGRLQNLYNTPNQLEVGVRGGSWHFLTEMEDFVKMTENISGMFMLHHAE